jgi:EAL domain-containing protein (putative c-di-GMP-specific phosphodiesterase class I)
MAAPDPRVHPAGCIHPRRRTHRPDRPLGAWILQTALRQYSQWNIEFGTTTPHSISVNVSARQLREPAFAADLDDALIRSEDS